MLGKAWDLSAVIASLIFEILVTYKGTQEPPPDTQGHRLPANEITTNDREVRHGEIVKAPPIHLSAESSFFTHHSSCVLSLTQVTSNTTDGELKTSLARGALGALLVATATLSFSCRQGSNGEKQIKATALCRRSSNNNTLRHVQYRHN